MVWLTGGLLAAGADPTLATPGPVVVLHAGPRRLPARPDRDGDRPRPRPRRHRAAGALRRVRADPGAARRLARRPGRAGAGRDRRAEHGQGHGVDVQLDLVGNGVRRRARLRRDERSRGRRGEHGPGRVGGRGLRRGAGAVRPRARHRPPVRPAAPGTAAAVASADPERGAIGATFGFPGGGGLVVAAPPRSPGRTRRTASTSTARSG